MALKKRSASNPLLRRGYVPPLPHPSWRVVATANGGDGAAMARIASATDFWDRLGHGPIIGTAGRKTPHIHRPLP